MITNAVADVCPKPRHVDGKSHIWLFDGDDPYIKCDACKEVRDAITGRIIAPIESTVACIPDGELLRRAVKSARANENKGRKHPRWVAVMHCFGLGSTYSRQLCERFGFDPEEQVKR